MSKDIPAKKFAGVLLVLIPMLFFITLYLRFDCGGGHCSIPMEWLIMGFFLIVFGIVVLVSQNGSSESEALRDRLQEVSEELEETKKKLKKAKKNA